MSGKYESLRDTFDGLVKLTVPNLTAETVDVAVNAVNTLVRLQTPVDEAFSDKPRVLLGLTSDGEKVVYGEVGRFGSYHAVLFDELYDRVVGMRDKAQIASALEEVKVRAGERPTIKLVIIVGQWMNLYNKQQHY